MARLRGGARANGDKKSEEQQVAPEDPSDAFRIRKRRLARDRAKRSSAHLLDLEDPAVQERIQSMAIDINADELNGDGDGEGGLKAALDMLDSPTDLLAMRSAGAWNLPAAAADSAGSRHRDRAKTGWDSDGGDGADVDAAAAAAAAGGGGGSDDSSEPLPDDRPDRAHRIRPRKENGRKRR